MSLQKNTFDIWPEWNTCKLIDFNSTMNPINFPKKIKCCRVGIEHVQGESQNAYLAATSVAKPQPPQTIREEQPMATTPTAPSDTDSDSN